MNRHHGALCLLLLAICLLQGTWVKAGDMTGTRFPFSDVCVRSPHNSRWDLQFINATTRTNCTLGSSFCFRVKLKPESECQVKEIWRYPTPSGAVRGDMNLRCCGTYLNKIKVFANKNCNSSRYDTLRIWSPYPELQANFSNRAISKSGDQTTEEGYSVKWSWRSLANVPRIPMDKIDGTEFCFFMRKARRTATSALDQPVCQNMLNITNPKAPSYAKLRYSTLVANGQSFAIYDTSSAALGPKEPTVYEQQFFEVALYDDMITDPNGKRYECCPAYGFHIPEVAPDQVNVGEIPTPDIPGPDTCKAYV